MRTRTKHAPAENEIKKAFGTMTVKKQGNREAIDIADLCLTTYAETSYTNFCLASLNLPWRVVPYAGI